jgi:hypothetical protein
MSNWSSETVSQRSDNIITKGKNDKTIKWSTTDYINVICRQTILRSITIKEVLILVTNILDHIVLKV